MSVLRWLAIGAVRVLVFLYPPGYRRRFGAAMVSDFCERLEDRSARGVVAVAGLMVRTVGDLVATAASEWLAPSDRGAGCVRRRDREGAGRVGLVDRLRTDVAFAWRLIVRRPIFTVVAVLTLALGVGANTAIFSAVNGVLLRPLPLGRPDRLVMVWESNVGQGWTRGPVAPASIHDWREQVTSIRDMTAYGPGVATVAGDGLPEVVTAAFVMGNFFDVVGVRAAQGRALVDDETWADAAPAVVLSDALWSRRFGRDPRVIGSVITVDEVAREVVGIMPAGFDFPFRGTGVWLPLGWDRSARQRSWFRRERFLSAIARLEDGVTPAAANLELGVVAARLQAQREDADGATFAGLTPLKEFLSGESRTPLLILLGASALILLLACVNVANLLLVRANEREPEMALRAALGAGRSRLLSQSLTECLVLALIGGTAGFGTAMIGVRALRVLRPPEALQLDALAIDGRVLLFALAVTLGTGALFGLGPALRGAASSAAATLSRRVWSSEGRQSRRLGQVLVVTEMALAVLLVASAGLLLRSFVAVRQVDPGFRIDDRVAASIFLPDRYGTDAELLAFVDDLVPRIERIRGVEAVTWVSRLPFTGTTSPFGGFAIEGRGLQRNTEPVGNRIVAAGYFGVMGIPVLRGRAFDESDRSGMEPVMVINERMARRFFPGKDATGRRLTWDETPDSSSRWYRIVGVVGDEHQNGVRSQPQMEAFIPFRQLPSARIHFIIQTHAGVAMLAEALRVELAAVDPKLPLMALQPLDRLYGALLGRDRFLLSLIGSFAILALVLASVGVYGLMAALVARHSRELGIRVALGAAPRQVALSIFARGLAPAAIGVVLGLGSAFGLTRILATVLYGVRPTDPLTFIGVTAILMLIASVACAIPALRAARLEPTAALRLD